jgi:hypothetical protein
MNGDLTKARSSTSEPEKARLPEPSRVEASTALWARGVSRGLGAPDGARRFDSICASPRRGGSAVGKGLASFVRTAHPDRLRRSQSREIDMRRHRSEVVQGVSPARSPRFAPARPRRLAHELSPGRAEEHHPRLPALARSRAQPRREHLAVPKTGSHRVFETYDAIIAAASGAASSPSPPPSAQSDTAPGRTWVRNEGRWYNESQSTATGISARALKPEMVRRLLGRPS